MALLGLAGCEGATPMGQATAPVNRPIAELSAAAPVAPPAQAALPDNSRVLSASYRRLESDLLGQGLLRTDGGGPDTTFTDTMLARNFVRIALFDEYVSTAQGLRAQPTISPLRRWEQPVRFAVEFGATVPQVQRTQDTSSVRSYVNRLARLTGRPMSVSDTNPNFHVLVLNEDDRAGFEGRLRQIVPGIDETSLRAFMEVPRDTLCLVLAFSRDNNSQYAQAVALIRGEHPDLMRLACIHEELAQGLGLANDSPQARPSIFNDDEEFALLTSHDELLLKILYDDRLQSGMSASDAAPIARQIARELLNTGPS